MQVALSHVPVNAIVTVRPPLMIVVSPLTISSDWASTFIVPCRPFVQATLDSLRVAVATVGV